MASVLLYFICSHSAVPDGRLSASNLESFPGLCGGIVWPFGTSPLWIGQDSVLPHVQHEAIVSLEQAPPSSLIAPLLRIAVRNY